MQEIKCPNCNQVFQVDESGYAQIAHQVRDAEFNREVQRRVDEIKNSQKTEQELALRKNDSSWDVKLKERESHITSLEKELERLSARLNAFETEKKLAVSDALHTLEQEVSERKTEIADLKGKLIAKESETELKIKSLEEKHQAELRFKDEEIEQYKDFKLKLSTKMVGESLEQHCLTQFNQLRTTAFSRAYFEKDNDDKEGTKGDFIFRDFSEDGTEFISIMFEMKNEMETTADKNKHTNEYFFSKLDKDRKTKNCEYAILVSLLEKDSELYNTGIVDVSYRYEKMYVIRPQFFIPMITLLRDAALKSLEYQKELQIVRNQQLDLQNFENEMETFKSGFTRNYELASKKFNDAIDQIDKTIAMLNKIKENLQGSENNLRLANNKAQELTIKKLTKNSPSLKQMFDNQKNLLE